MAKKKKPQREILYCHVDRSTKTWLNERRKKQVEPISLSAMVRRILIAAKQNPKLFNAAIK